jgi:hypothetical protein
MVSDYCKSNLNDPKFQGLSKEDQEQIMQDVDDIVGASTDRRQAEMALDEYDRKLALAKKLQKVNAHRNRAVQARLVEMMIRFGDDPKEGLIAYMLGSQKLKDGARFNVATQIDVETNSLLNNLGKLLTAKGVLPLAKSDKLALETRRYLFMKDKGEDVSMFSDEVKAIGDAFQTVFNQQRKIANENGALVAHLDGYIGAQNHDRTKIRLKKEAWLNFMRANIDLKRSIFGGADLEKSLQEQWSEFASGVHLTEDLGLSSEGQALSGYASVAKAMSHVRKIVFKTPEAEHEYARLFGNGSLMDSVVSSLTANGRRLAILKQLGPNPEMNVNSAIDQAAEYYKSKGVPKQMAALAEGKDYFNRNIYPRLSGRSNIPGHHVMNEVVATIDYTQRTLTRSSLLANTGLAMLTGDPVTSALAMTQTDPGVKGFFNNMYKMLSGLFRNIKNPIVQDIMADLAVTYNYYFHDVTNRFNDDFTTGGTQAAVQRAESFVFKWTAQHFLDNRLRVAASMTTANNFGRKARLSYDNLPKGHKQLLQVNGITPGEWDIIRSSKKDTDLGEFIDIESIADSAGLDGLITAQGKKPTDFNRRKIASDIIAKFRNLMQDEQNYSIIGVDQRTSAYFYGSTKKGDLRHVLASNILLLKSWPISYMRRMGGRWWYYNEGVAQHAFGAMGILTAMTAAGYVLLQLTEMTRGREPREMSQDLVLDSMLRGGGMGIYADMANYVALESKFGDFLLKASGPSGQNLGILYNIMTNENKDKSVVDLARRYTPGINFFMVKPVVDYLLLNAAAEAANPGGLLKAERRRREENGNNYFVPPPHESMLFEFN